MQIIVLGLLISSVVNFDTTPATHPHSLNEQIEEKIKEVEAEKQDLKTQIGRNTKYIDNCQNPT